MSAKPFVSCVWGALVAAYPLAAYFAIEQKWWWALGLILVLVSGLRWHFQGVERRWIDHALFLAVLGLVVTALVWDQQVFYLFYPALVSWAVALLFCASLREEESAIEKLSRLAGKTITPNAKRYTRKLTAVWAALLILNGLVVAGLAVGAPNKIWALYSGILSYVIFAAVFLVEWVYRRHYIRTYGA